MKKKISLYLLSLFVIFTVNSQDLSQTVRGRIIDKQTRQPIPGANIIIQGSDPIQGSVSDLDGYFAIEKVKLGRVSLRVSYLGYSTVSIPNIMVSAGKQPNMEIELEEEVIQTKEVTISASRSKAETNNDYAPVSARTFSVEESQRYAGSLNDVARMATNFAGVRSANDASNEIIIRGNTPNGLLWRLEGVEIPNPNHYGGMGATGGPVGMLNNNVLANSDFLTSAFPGEYGNCVSGVFDLTYRNGNNKEHEFLGQVGWNGFELGAEGPFSKSGKSSYLFNYRYSTLSFVKKIGIDMGTGIGVPNYQDLSFKLNFYPGTRSRLVFFGLSGLNDIDFLYSQKDTAQDDESFYSGDGIDVYNKNRMGVIGGHYTFFPDSKSYLRLTLSTSDIKNDGKVDSVGMESLNVHPFSRTMFHGQDLIAFLKYSRKLSARTNVQAGIKAKNMHFDLIDSNATGPGGSFIIDLNAVGNTQLYTAYVQAQHKFSKSLTLNLGVHYQNLALNGSQSVEPRTSIVYQTTKAHRFSLGYGLHSMMSPLFMLMLEYDTPGGSRYKPNEELDFFKSHHLALGYDYTIGDKFRVKLEGYYQYLYDVPVSEVDPYFSILNSSSQMYSLPDSMYNGGTGDNIGLELTVEKFLDKGSYFLFTASVFDSKYKGSNGLERSTQFDGGYVFNLLGGKEWQLFKKKENSSNKSWIVVDAKVMAAGGQRYTPVDIQASMNSLLPKYDLSRVYEDQFENYFRADVRIAYRRDGKKISQEFAFDLQNVTNHKNPLHMQYNPDTQEQDVVYQLGFFPMMQYKIMF